jgi:hypothetical protein
MDTVCRLASYWFNIDFSSVCSDSINFIWTKLYGCFATIASGYSVILVAGYVFAILAHYRLILSEGRTGPRDNPEPSERLIIKISIIVGSIVALVIYLIN